MDTEWLTPEQAAKRLGVSTQTLLRWEAKGTFVAHRTPGGHRRFDAQQIDDYLAEQSA